MNIHSKTLSVIAFSLLTTALANFFVLKMLVFPTFLKLEQQAAASNIQRVMEAINSEIEDVDKTLWDYSSWDDTYKYAQGDYNSYPEGNLAVEALRNLRLDIVEVYNARGATLFDVVFDRAENRARSAGWTLVGLAENQALLTLPEDGRKTSGVTLTPNGPAIFASRPIVKSSGEGPSVGTFLFGQFLNEEWMASLNDRIKVDFTLTQVHGLSEPERHAYRQLLDTSEQQVVDEHSPDQLIAYALIRSLQGQPVLLVSATVKRDISQIGQKVLIASVGGVAATAILVMAVLAVLLQWVLVGPLVRLTQHVVEIGADGALSRRVALQRRDEIGILGREFNQVGIPFTHAAPSAGAGSLVAMI